LSAAGWISMDMNPNSVRARFERAFAGEPVDWPVYAAYDWFVKNRPIDWPSLFAQGLGQIAHVDLVRVERPHLQVVETKETVGGEVRRTVRWITDMGEVREVHLGEWQQEHFVKTPADYRVLRRAFEDSRYTATAEFFHQSEAELGDAGITVGALGWTPLRRTPLLQVQVDFAGPERFALDMADEVPELLELLELLADLTLQKFREAVKTPARHIKLWENLTIDMLGAANYRRWLVPLYRQILDIMRRADRRLLVHYDGKLKAIAPDIAALDFELDSFTPPPDGDMLVAEARAAWPDKFLWLHPPLDWFRESQTALVERIRQMARDAGPRRFCLMISEEVPDHWQRHVPAVLEALAKR
jgi:hypothetical protein